TPLLADRLRAVEDQVEHQLLQLADVGGDWGTLLRNILPYGDLPRHGGLDNGERVTDHLTDVHRTDLPTSLAGVVQELPHQVRGAAGGAIHRRQQVPHLLVGRQALQAALQERYV